MPTIGPDFMERLRGFLDVAQSTLTDPRWATEANALLDELAELTPEPTPTPAESAGQHVVLIRRKVPEPGDPALADLAGVDVLGPYADRGEAVRLTKQLQYAGHVALLRTAVDVED